MSYQAHEYVCDLRGVSRGEKAVLQVIARHLDQRTGVARVSQEQIGADAEMDESQPVFQFDLVRLVLQLLGQGQSALVGLLRLAVGADRRRLLAGLEQVGQRLLALAKVLPNSPPAGWWACVSPAESCRCRAGRS